MTYYRHRRSESFVENFKSISTQFLDKIAIPIIAFVILLFVVDACVGNYQVQDDYNCPNTAEMSVLCM